LLRHNLDVMHIEKNVMDNILGTILNIKGKTKDNLAARLDLQEMGLRPKLHLFTAANGKTYMPASCHTMSREDKESFFEGSSKCEGPGRIRLEHFTVCSAQGPYNFGVEEP
jgi:hypothetical protein